MTTATSSGTTHSSADCTPDLPCMGLLACDVHRPQGVVVSLIELTGLPGIPDDCDYDCVGFLRYDRHRR
ncbi:hypothetical protein ACIPYS_21520 [Kitasatospora sp. NPDC089913]|uniref:hypothetical protein n=1 Tax=Kitasatospora sp. NPDC089913 TaxID=3364080 RepID=UPI00087A2782|nr:hypothetical protein SAMN05216371_0168 [Streptomyces sp. TLI_053]